MFAVTMTAVAALLSIVVALGVFAGLAFAIGKAIVVVERYPLARRARAPPTATC